MIGLPLAVRQLVRWSLVSQAVILGHCSPWRALRHSSELVDRNWWRVLGLTSVLGFIGIVSGPIVGIVLLLYAPGSLTFFDLAASVLYVAALPYVALALTLLYFDLAARRAGDGHLALRDLASRGASAG